MKLLMHEVLQKASNAKTKKEKIALLHKFNTQALRSLFIINFDESVVSMLPQGDVPYTPNEAPVGTDHSRLEHEYRGLYRFFKGGDNRLKNLKREQMFVQLLEGLHESEAELLVNAKDKKLHQVYKGLSTNVVCEAFNWNDNFMLMQ